MRYLTLFLLAWLLAQTCYSQQQVTLTGGKKMMLLPLWKMQDSLYFYKTTSKDTVFKMPLASLQIYPDNWKTIKRINPDMYFLKYRNAQLTGIWLELLGTLTTSLVYGATGEKAALYAGGAFNIIGFIVYMSGYSNMQKYYVVRNAIPYKP